MKKKLHVLLLSAFCFVFAFGGFAYAFEDIQGNPAEKSIRALAKAGVISGVDDSHFAPQAGLTYAQGVQLLVKGLGLNIDPLRFIKAPQASDYYTSVPNEAWYANAMVIAHLNDIPLAKDVDPNQLLSREQFAYFLAKAIAAKGDYAYIEMFVEIADGQEINPDYMDSIQKMLVSHVIELDHENRFHPKGSLTRGQAAQWVHAAIQFVQSHNNTNPSEPNSQPDVTVASETIAQGVLKVTIGWGVKPNTGYSISIDKIEFNHDSHEALISYRLHEPLPGHMYGQVITEPKAFAYIPDSYKPVTQQLKP